jgi:hypothetical protein
MAVCSAYGIPHSAFTSWDRDDRDKALWWHIYKAETCQSCGTRPEEWDESQGGDLHAYVAEPIHCRGCEVRAGADERFERDKKQYRRGTRIELRRSGPEED